MKKFKTFLPYIALAIAIILQYYVAYNNRVDISQNNQASYNGSSYGYDMDDINSEDYNKMVGKVGLSKSIDE